MASEDIEARRARMKELEASYKPFGDHVHYNWRDPIPAGMADRVKVMRELWQWATHVQRHYCPEIKDIFTTKCERSKGYLYGGSAGCIASGYIGSSKEFELIAMALNALPELLDAWEAQNKEAE